MRFCPSLCVLCAISLTGCYTRSEPEARRSEAVSTPAESSPAATTDESPVNPHAQEATTDKPAAEGTGEAESGSLRLEKLVFAVPEGWKRQPASSSFVLAELTLPKADGDEADGRLTVSSAGGTIEANIERWRGQFGGKPEPASEERKQIKGIDVTFVDFSGEFNDQRGPIAPAAKHAGYRMLAAIIPLEGGFHFVKAVGPQATIAAHAERFQQFVGSVEKKD